MTSNRSEIRCAELHGPLLTKAQYQAKHTVKGNAVAIIITGLTYLELEYIVLLYNGLFGCKLPVALALLPVYNAVVLLAHLCLYPAIGVELPQRLVAQHQALIEVDLELGRVDLRTTCTKSYKGFP